jgi:hypothetical protein
LLIPTAQCASLIDALPTYNLQLSIFRTKDPKFYFFKLRTNC